MNTKYKMLHYMTPLLMFERYVNDPDKDLELIKATKEYKDMTEWFISRNITHTISVENETTFEQFEYSIWVEADQNDMYHFKKAFFSGLDFGKG